MKKNLKRKVYTHDTGVKSKLLFGSTEYISQSGGKSSGKKKKTEAPRMSSSSLMQEAKKLMQFREVSSSSSRSSPVHMSCQTSVATARFTVFASCNNYPHVFK